MKIVKQINSAAHESPGPDFKTWRVFKVLSTQSYWCKNGESPLVLRISAPPFDTQASASLQAASVDRSTSGPAAIHKSLWERCALPHMSAPWVTVGNPSVQPVKQKVQLLTKNMLIWLCRWPPYIVCNIRGRVFCAICPLKIERHATLQKGCIFRACWQTECRLLRLLLLGGSGGKQYWWVREGNEIFLMNSSSGFQPYLHIKGFLMRFFFMYFTRRIQIKMILDTDCPLLVRRIHLLAWSFDFLFICLSLWIN